MENLSELRDRIMSLPTLENRIEHLKDAIKKADDEVYDLLKQYKRESRDVEQIQKKSLSSYMLKVIGKYEEKLEKERLEEINAKLAYDRVTANRDSLIKEKEELSAYVSELHNEERAYQTELTIRKQKLAGKSTEPNGIRYTELENERKEIIAQMTEIKEALKVVYRAETTAQKALNSLESAKGWATYDAFSRGGIISHMAKYSHIDSAEQDFHTLSSQLQELKDELNDVDGLTVSNLNEISSTQRVVDFWFDNIFTDLSVRGQIKDNINQINNLLDNINEVESMLNSKLFEQDTKLDENKRKEEELILSME